MGLKDNGAAAAAAAETPDAATTPASSPKRLSNGHVHPSALSAPLPPASAADADGLLHNGAGDVNDNFARADKSGKKKKKPNQTFHIKKKTSNATDRSLVSK